MDADHEWTTAVFAADCQPCPCCGEALCPRCHDHYAECPCPGPHQDDTFYYRQIGGELRAIPRDSELDPDDEREPDDQAEPDLEVELRAEDDYEGPEPDDEDDGYDESVFDRIEWADFVAEDSLDGAVGGEG